MKSSCGNDQRQGSVAGEGCRVKVIIIMMMMMMEDGNLYGDENVLADGSQFMGRCPCVGERRRGPGHEGSYGAQIELRVHLWQLGNGRAQSQVGWKEVMDSCVPSLLVALLPQ